MIKDVTVAGGGLAGSELALQLSDRGIAVRLVEMRPAEPTPAHKTGYLAELVCSNSLKSENLETASGLLKAELHTIGCRLLKAAEECRVPAGHALAVDREMFARGVTELIGRTSLIDVVRSEQKTLDLPQCSIVATGPLTSPPLSKAIQEHFSADNLYFYDAISISVGADSVDFGPAFRASRYGKGGEDYWNIPFTVEEYSRLVEFLRGAPKARKRDFEELRCFEACLPAEVLANRGEDTLRYGPMKPRGLPMPGSGREPYAVLQLRQETRDGTMLGLVGFQTRLTIGAQKELMRFIPGMADAEILRWGSIHRNTFLDSPRLLDGRQMSRRRSGLFFSGQIVGVEGYMECIAHGLVTAMNVASFLKGGKPVIFPSETLTGSLQRHLAEGKSPFQPMNVNFGLLPGMGCRKKDRKRLLAERSLESLESFLRG